MPVNECVPFFEEADTLTCRVSSDVIGKRCVAISGNRTGGPGLSTDLANLYQVAPATAAGLILGVAAYDAVAGTNVPVICEGIVPIKAAGNIAAGAEVEVGSAGQVVTIASGKAIGRCMTAVSSGADAEIKLYV